MRLADGFFIMGSSGDRIDSVDRWFEVAPPRGRAAQWVDGYSAKELAKAWFRTGAPSPPRELAALLDSSALTRDVAATVAIAEHATHFDANGGPRKHDLLFVLRGEAGLVIASVEAKVRESLGPRVIERLEAADAAKEGSQVRARVEGLVAALFGRTLDDVKLGALRYQLLTATAGILVEAKERGARAALLIVHDLGTIAHGRDAFTPTELDVRDFVLALGGEALPLGTLVGPLKVPGCGRVPGDIPLYVAVIEATPRR